MHLDSKWTFFFLSAMCPCISKVLEKLTRWKKLCHFTLHVSRHASLNTDFFFPSVITIPLSHFKNYHTFPESSSTSPVHIDMAVSQAFFFIYCV